MKIKDSISTFFLKCHFSLIHLRHRLFHAPTDVTYGEHFISSTFDLSFHHQKGTLKIGRFVRFGRRVDLSVSKNAVLEIGDHVTISGPICIGCDQKITIGDHTTLGEFSTIRDSDHGIDRDKTMDIQPCRPSPITIGKEVCIGAGCTILKGAVIPDGCIIGAHSMVLQKSQLLPYGIYAGTPVRLIRMR